MKRIAIVDVGSNTAKLIALAYEPGRSWRQLDELRAVVRLSEGLEQGGELGAKPFARGLAALRTFASYAEAAEVDDLVATNLDRDGWAITVGWVFENDDTIVLSYNSGAH